MFRAIFPFVSVLVFGRGGVRAVGVYYMQGACATEDAADGSIGADRPEQPPAWRAALPAAGSCCTRQRGRDVACAEILDGGVRDARESERGGRKVKGTPHMVVARARGPGRPVHA